MIQGIIHLFLVIVGGFFVVGIAIGSMIASHALHLRVNNGDVWGDPWWRNILAAVISLLIVLVGLALTWEFYSFWYLGFLGTLRG